MDYTLKDFHVGQRVQLHPATDLWMRGARYGEVIQVGTKYVRVQLDRLPKSIRICACNLLPIHKSS